MYSIAVIVPTVFFYKTCSPDDVRDIHSGIVKNKNRIIISRAWMAVIHRQAQKTQTYITY